MTRKELKWLLSLAVARIADIEATAAAGAEEGYRMRSVICEDIGIWPDELAKRAGDMLSALSIPPGPGGPPLTIVLMPDAIDLARKVRGW